MSRDDELQADGSRVLAERERMLALVGFIAMLQADALPPESPGRHADLPGYLFLRQDEDWSNLAFPNASAGADWSDRLKWIPLNDSGKVRLSIGGHARARFEAWRGFNFGAPPTRTDDDEFFLTRFLLHSDLRLGDHVRVFGELKTAQSTRRELVGGTRPIDVDSFAVQQLFLDLEPVPDTLRNRAGRQMLSFGKQRLVSPLPWGNTLRTWDGASVRWQERPWAVTGFWMMFAPVDIGDFNESDAFYGVYATHAGPGIPVAIDLFVLVRDRERPALGNPALKEERVTVGTRIHGETQTAPFDFDVEVAHQFGEIGDAGISAEMISIEVGYTDRSLSSRPRAWLGFDYASGARRTGGSVGTFNQLFPLGHAYFGFIDAVGRQNIVHGTAGVSNRLTERSRRRVSFHFFWLADADDALYNAGGAHRARRDVPIDVRGGGGRSLDDVAAGAPCDFDPRLQPLLPRRRARGRGASERRRLLLLRTAVHILMRLSALSHVAGVAILASCAAPAPEESLDWREEPHHLSVLLYVTIEEDESAPSAGLDYEYRATRFLGLGAVAEQAFDTIQTTTLLVVADLHITDQFIVQTGPGVEFVDGEQEAVYRFGVLYEFERGGYTVSPQLHYDMASGEDSVIIGVAVGVAF